MNQSSSVGTAETPEGPAAPPAGFTHPWQPDQGDGTYRNPILYADYSDPDVIRVGDDFYLVASSFNCTPGLPLLHSRDLVNWTIMGHALKNLPHPRYEEVQPGCGVWAPAIRFHAGKFWIFFPTPDEGLYVTTADHPGGHWSEPHMLQAGKGLIDPCPLWDEDGRAYLVHAYARSRSGLKDMLNVRPMAADGSRLLGEGQIVFHDPQRHPTLEGPKFLKKDGWYYIFAPAGGVETGWQVVMRSRNIYGPYDDKIVLAQGDTAINGPHQGALVDTPDDGWWFLHFQDAGLYGRIIHLQPVQWHEGWPVMGRNGEPVLRHKKPFIVADQPRRTPQTSDEFESERLGPQWQWHANHHDDWHSLTVRPGWLRLYPQLAASCLSRQPNLLLQKFPARHFAVETGLELSGRQAGEEAGLAVVGEKSARFGLQYDGRKHWLVLRRDDQPETRCEAASHKIKLRVEVGDGGCCSFSHAEAGEFHSLPETFQAMKGTWIGAKLGLYSIKKTMNGPAGNADFRCFHFR